MSDDGAIPVVDVEALLIAVKAEIESRESCGEDTPDYVVMNPWHFECLLAWSVEERGVSPTATRLLMDVGKRRLKLVEIVPNVECGDDPFTLPTFKAFVATRKVG